MKQNQFGAAAGGPIKKDKTFIFGFYEGFRNRQGETTLTTVPSLRQRTGDFSELCPEGFSGGFCNNPAHQLFNVFANAPYQKTRYRRINSTRFRKTCWASFRFLTRVRIYSPQRKL